MIQRLSILATLALTVAAGSAQAQVYTELAGGFGRHSNGCEGAVDCRAKGASLRATVGYMLNEPFGLEIGAVQLPGVRVRDELIDDSLGVRTPFETSLRVRGVQLGARMQLPLENGFSVQARGGLSRLWLKPRISPNDAGITFESERQHTTAPYAALGVSYAVSPTQSVGLMAEGVRMKVDGERSTASSLQVTWQSRF